MVGALARATVDETSGRGLNTGQALRHVSSGQIRSSFIICTLTTAAAGRCHDARVTTQAYSSP